MPCKQRVYTMQTRVEIMPATENDDCNDILNTDWREAHPRLSARTTQVSNTCQLQQHFKSNTCLSRELIVTGRETEKVKPLAGTLI